MAAARSPPNARVRRSIVVVSESTERIGALDGLRAIAALTVFVYHLLVLSPIVATLGGPLEWEYYGRNFDIGVEIFFVLSGYLLSRPFFRAFFGGSGVSRLRDYAIRRALRVYPAWLAFLVVAISWNQFAFLDNTNKKPDDVLSIVGWGTLLHTWFFDPGHSSWTLSVEVAFYVALPVFALLLFKFSKSRSLAAALFGCAALTACGFAFEWWHLMFFNAQRFVPAALVALGPGVALGALKEFAAQSEEIDRRLRRFARPTLAWWLGATALFLAMSRLVSRHGYVIFGPSPPPHETIKQSLLQALIAFVLVGSTVFGSSSSFAVRAMSARALVAFGRLSYSFYLWHLLVLYQWENWLTVGSAGVAWRNAAFAFAITTAVAAVSFLVIEQPSIAFANRLVKRGVERRSQGSGF